MKNLSPLKTVKEKFGSKEKLVEKVVELIAQTKEESEDLKERLATAANAKLLKLYETGTELKEKFGSKEKLVENILSIQNRIKDNPYKEKLMTYSIPKLMDMVKGLNKKK